MPWRAKPVPGRVNRLTWHTSPALQFAAEGFADQMSENYKEGPRSGGLDYRTKKPRSIPGEFPQEQSGQLRSAITFKKDDSNGSGITWLVGLDASLAIRSSLPNQAPLEEYLGYIEGYGSGGFDPVASSRFGLTMTAESYATYANMKRFMAKSLPANRFSWGW